MQTVCAPVADVPSTQSNSFSASPSHTRYQRHQGLIGLSLVINIKRLKSDSSEAVQQIGRDLQELFELPQGDRKHQCQLILSFLKEDELTQLKQSRVKILANMSFPNVLHPLKQRPVHPSELIQDCKAYSNTVQSLLNQARSPLLSQSDRDKLQSRAHLAQEHAENLRAALEEWLERYPEFNDLLEMLFSP